MKLLALDAATEHCSLALALDGVVHESQHNNGQNKHAEALLPSLHQLLLDHGLKLTELDGIVFDQGPGSFTGVRLTLSVAQGLAWGAQLPLIPINSLHALAWSLWQQKRHAHVLAALDARMGEVYAAAFFIDNTGHIHETMAACVTDPNRIQLPCPDAEKTWSGVGSGWQQHATALLQSCPGHIGAYWADRLPSAADLVAMVIHNPDAYPAIPPAQARPCYLRNQVTHQPKT